MLSSQNMTGVDLVKDVTEDLGEVREEMEEEEEGGGGGDLENKGGVKEKQKEKKTTSEANNAKDKDQGIKGEVTALATDSVIDLCFDDEEPLDDLAGKLSSQEVVGVDLVKDVVVDLGEVGEEMEEEEGGESGDRENKGGVKKEKQKGKKKDGSKGLTGKMAAISSDTVIDLCSDKEESSDEEEPRDEEEPSEDLKAKKGARKKKKKKKKKNSLAQAENFINRLSTLVVMVITTMTAILTCVASFVEGVDWEGFVFLWLLVFVHVPTLGLLMYSMCKARMKTVVRMARKGTVVGKDLKQKLRKTQQSLKKQALDGLGSDANGKPRIRTKKGLENNGFDSDTDI